MMAPTTEPPTDDSTKKATANSCFVKVSGSVYEKDSKKKENKKNITDLIWFPHVSKDTKRD
jgi:hypothetical protein